MMVVKAYPDERSTNKNNPSVKIMIKNFDKRTGFILISSIRKKRITKASENNSQTYD
jgi:hypothetical protein